jgi:hypothetical protein
VPRALPVLHARDVEAVAGVADVSDPESNLVAGQSASGVIRT